MLSQKDAKILEILMKNCKMPSRKISEKTGIPITTIHNRVKKMEKDGIIKSYKAVVDKKKTGKSIQAFIHINAGLKNHNELARRISLLPEVDECYVLTGTTDIMIKISANDVDHLNDFVMNDLKGVRGVNKTLTAIILKEI